MQEAEKLGYLTVGLKVDPDDWQKPTPEQIVERVVAQTTDPDPEKRGQIVLLHDAGGDRAATVAALPKLIDTLRAKGFEFVAVSELARWTKDQAMPPVPANEASPVVNRYVFFTFSWLQGAVTTLFLAAIGLGLARLSGSLRSGACRPRAGEEAWTFRADADELSVSVLIPAYNEAKVIAASIRQILASTHREAPHHRHRRRLDRRHVRRCARRVLQSDERVT